MSDEEPTREELLDNLPEAVAMRKAREKRAADAARREAMAHRPSGKADTKRRWLVGAVLGLATAARVGAKFGGRGATRKP